MDKKKNEALSPEEEAREKQQAAQEKLQQLIDEGKKKGSIAASDLTVLEELNLDQEQMDKFLEAVDEMMKA